MQKREDRPHSKQGRNRCKHSSHLRGAFSKGESSPRTAVVENVGAGDEHRVKCGPLTARRILKTRKCGSGVHRPREGNPHIHAKRV